MVVSLYLDGAQHGLKIQPATTAISWVGILGLTQGEDTPGQVQERYREVLHPGLARPRKEPQLKSVLTPQTSVCYYEINMYPSDSP